MGPVSALTLEQRLAAARQMIPPGSQWTHYKQPEDTPYEVVEIGLLEGTEETVVVYRKPGNVIVWVRPAAQFLAEVHLGVGAPVPRFKRVA